VLEEIYPSKQDVALVPLLDVTDNVLFVSGYIYLFCYWESLDYSLLELEESPRR
jgi:hypothetical protein